MRPEVKICGLKKPADAQYVNDAGADYAGFVFYEKSRRNLSRQQAEEIMKKISPRIKKVAVTVSPDAAQIKTLQQMKFDIIQMHGKLSEDAITAAELPVWYAINLSDPEEFEAKTKSFFELPEELQQKLTAIVVVGAGSGGGQRVVGRRGHGDGRRVLGAVIRDAIGVAGDLHERVLVRAGSVERQLVESDSAIGCVRGSARHPPRTQPQGERLRFARHRRRDRIRPRRRQQRCRYARPPVHEQVQEPGRAVHVGRRRHRPRPDHQGCG